MMNLENVHKYCTAKINVLLNNSLEFFIKTEIKLGYFNSVSKLKRLEKMFLYQILISNVLVLEKYMLQ